MDGRTNRRNKATFSKFCGVLWTGPQCSIEMESSY